MPPKRTTSELSRHEPSSKSEGEEEGGGSGRDQQQQQHHGAITTINVHHPSSHAKMAGATATLGRTPNHLTLSTTSTLSVGSTGSQARLIQSSHAPSMYQPVTMKDLGKDDEQDANTTSGGGDGLKAKSVVGGKEDPGVGNEGGYAAMDRHLNAFNMNENTDIVDYMQTLKVKHLEIQLSEEKQDEENDKGEEEKEKEKSSADEKGLEPPTKQSEEPKVVKAPVTTKSQKERHNETQKSEKLILNIDASSVVTSTSPIKIIKIKSRSRSVSPRRPLPGAEVVVSNKALATEKGIEEGSVAKTHGILKRSASSKSVESTQDFLSTPTGILKRSLSPKDLAKLDGLSPRNSFDSRASPVRSPQSEYCHSPCSQPNTVIDNRSVVKIVKHKARSAKKSTSRIRSVSASASVCNSLDSESSNTAVSSAKKRRSLSTSNFDQSRMSSMESEVSLMSPSHYCPRSCFSSGTSLNSGNNSFDNDLSSLHNSHERIFYDNPIVIQSQEYRGRRSNSSANDALLSRAIEHPTCMECILVSRTVS